MGDEYLGAKPNTALPQAVKYALALVENFLIV
jgi:hypothetical protein